MRPLRLTMQAFGPYAGCQKLDFDELEGHEFFLIHGPTGSGKSTLLDAICYALYGETSGAGRSGAQMRCQQADENMQTLVIFDFRIGNKYYRIERKPEQEVAKKRGTGTTNRGAEATLWKANSEIDPGKDEAGWEPIEHKTTPVTAEMERLLGFSSEQFRQVILIPQGRFREVLESDSKKREEILETLFGTQKFSDLAERLKVRARELEEEAKQAVQKKNSLLEAHQVETEEALRARHAEVMESLATLENTLKEQTLSRNAADKSLQDARALDQRFIEAAEAEKEWADWQQRKSDIENQVNCRDLARNAESIATHHETLFQALAKENQLKTALETHRAKTLDIQNQRNQAVALLDAAKIELKRRDQLAFELEKIETLKPRLDEWEQAKQSVSGHLESVKKASEELARIKALVEAAEVKTNQAEAVAKDGHEARVQVPKLEAKEQQLQESLLTLSKAKSLQEAIAKSKQFLKEQQQESEQAALLLTSAEKEMLAEEKRWNEGQSALLASSLKDGEPCPVCGALHHPAPAEIGPDAVPSEEKLKTCRKTVEKARRDHQKVRESLLQLNSQLETQTSRLAELPLVEHSKGTLEKTLRELLQELSDQKQKIELTEKHPVDAARNELKAKQLRATDLEKQLHEKERDLDRAKSSIENLERDLPEELRSREAFSRKAQTLRTAVEEIVKRFDDAQAKAETTNQALTDHQIREQSLKEQWEELSRDNLERSKSWQQLLREKQFEDETAWQSARISAEELKNLEQKIEKMQSDFASSRTRHERAQLALKETKTTDRPDLEKLQAAFAAADSTLQQTHSRIGGLKQTRDQLDVAFKALEQLQQEFGVLESRYAVAGRVADAVNGKNPMGLTLQRFILTAFLDDTLIAASDRLLRMSRGRYRLERRRERTDMRRASGLDLDVFDEFTGHARAVNTLSGGESFLASLSLALGLADVVQSYAGGTRMDALFIDEGFGTLDPEALDEALKALLDLREKGRLVGIISHVPELKERIDVRLEVCSNRSGSTAKFLVAS